MNIWPKESRYAATALFGAGLFGAGLALSAISQAEPREPVDRDRVERESTLERVGVGERGLPTLDTLDGLGLPGVFELREEGGQERVNIPDEVISGGGGGGQGGSGGSRGPIGR